MVVRVFAFALPIVLTLACASSPTPEPQEDSPPPAQPAEVEGPAPTNDPEAAAAAEGLCTPASYSEWSTCEGKRVRVNGRNAQMVMQHPIVAAPPGLSPDNRNTHQGYMDVDDGGQVIVVTSEPFDCPGKMTVVGVLDGVRGNGPPGTKESYSGWSLTDAEVTCN
jgi:hypothetical protein